MEAVKLEQKRSVTIDPSRMRLAEYDRQDWIANVPEGVTIEDVQKPEFWSHMAQQIKPYDHIEVRAEDETWIAQLLVLRTDRTWAKVHLLKHYELTGAIATANIESKYEVQWKGPQKKWCVIRKSDNAIQKENCEKTEAIAWMDNHERMVG